jgi:C1A family cysteine protease
MMKRALWVLFFIVVCVSVATAAPKIQTYSSQNSGSTITLKHDTVVGIKLWSIPSSGYGWQAKNSLSKKIRILGSKYEPSTPGTIGGGGVTTIYVVGGDPGKTDLEMEYRRPHSPLVMDSVRFSFQTGAAFTESFSVPSPPKPTLMAGSQILADENLGALPSSFNWCDQGGCTPIKNQGLCGGCWAFSAVATLESAIKINDGDTVDLSEQYLISCNAENWGCQGGLWAHDYHMEKKVSGQSEAGAVLENDYPYTGQDGYCSQDYPKAYKIDDWAFVCGSQWCTPTTAQIKQAIYDHGTVSVAVCANDAMTNYSGGIFTSGCSELNHAVNLVGWNDDEGYWIMRNSWGANWGESGYMRIKYGVAGIGSDANYVVYSADSDPDPEPEPDPDPDPEPEPDPDTKGDEITNGETISDLSGSQSNWLHFYIDVPANATNLTVSLSDGSGDADLYTRYSAEPTTSEYDCRPYLDGNSETCTEGTPQGGRWYIGLRGWRDFSGVSLTADYDGEDTDQDPAPDPEPDPDPDPIGQCVTTSNSNHISQGRAYQCGTFSSMACAVGSGDNLGWASQWFSMTSSIEETDTDYWERVSNCP